MSDTLYRPWSKDDYVHFEGDLSFDSKEQFEAFLCSDLVSIRRRMTGYRRKFDIYISTKLPYSEDLFFTLDGGDEIDEIILTLEQQGRVAIEERPAD
jgi:hypothetical protein